MAANRDESYDRPTAPAHFWKSNPQILAGRDLQQQGTWLGITQTGRFAALTNFRDFNTPKSNRELTSRGEIVHRFLAGNTDPEQYLHLIHENNDIYDGFNVLVGDSNQLYHYNNIEGKITNIPYGTHSVSNHMLNTPWPKSIKGNQSLREYVMTQHAVDPNILFELLADRTIAPDEKLPNTGVGLELERKLSPLFIKMDHYGTRSSTVLLIDKNNQVTFIERTYKTDDLFTDEKFCFTIKN